MKNYVDYILYPLMKVITKLIARISVENLLKMLEINMPCTNIVIVQVLLVK